MLRLRFTYQRHIMAKSKSSKAFEFETISSNEASTRKSKRGRRRSKYSPIGERFADLKKGEVLVFKATKNEVQGIRNYMRRNFEDGHVVNSRSIDGDNFEVYLSEA